MNPLNSAYCRTFQSAFRLALPVLPYREPQVLASVKYVPDVLKREGKQKPLIVTDSNLVSLGLVDLVTDELDIAGIPFAIYSETSQNPTIANVEEAQQLYLDAGCDCIIAFGGGSPMDCAKAAGARIAKPMQSVRSMKGILKIHKRIPLLIAIPTTAGTGSETTLAAVITDEKTHHKYPINDFPLIPRYAVLDAHTTLGLPPFITATTGMDALVHATEAYIGRSTTAKAYIDWFEEMNERMGIPSTIDKIREEDILEMAANADKESNPLYPVPKLMDGNELAQLYRLVMPDDARETARPGAGSGRAKLLKKRSIEKIVADQRAFFDTGKTLDVDFRKATLKRLEASIKRHEAEIESALEEDLGKSFFESYMCEVGLTLSELRYQLSHVGRWAKPHLVMTDLAHFAAKSFTIAEPYGVALVMSPWNYPFMLTMEPLIGAVAAGNCCVVKPSAYSPRTSAIMERVIEEAFEPGHVDVVLGGREENSALLDQKFDYIFFTGSVGVGRTVLEKAAPNLTPVTLELGGKSPCLVAADANLEVAAARIAFGKWLNLGQTCVAPDYVLADSRIAERLARLVAREAARMYGENAFGNPDYGRMVNRKHFDRVMGLIDQNKVVYGGRSNEDTLQIEPTIMTGVTADDAVMGEEIFGPILPIIAVDSMDEAMEFAKKRDKPLAAYIFTSDKALEGKFLTGMSFGGGCINDTIVHLATSRMAFGGVGASGMGSYHGKASFDTFSHKKSILKKYTWLDLPLRYQPYNAAKLGLIKLFVR